MAADALGRIGQMPPVTQPSSRQHPKPPIEAAQPISMRSGKILSLLIALEALRQQSYALGAHKV
jgi:hypothetical protein